MLQNFIKILIVEDNDFDYELVIRKLNTLNFKYESKRVLIEEDFKFFLTHFSPDLILSDFSLPTFSGLEALRIAKKSHPLIPFVFVSGTIGEELAVETLLEGANDYVLKDNLNKLEHAIKRALSEATEKAQRKEAEEKLQVKVDELKNLVYRISHDIRGPICSIKGVVSLIENSYEKKIDEITDYVGMISQVNKKMEGIVLNLSSFQFIYGDEIKVDAIDSEDFFAKLKKEISEIDGFEDVDFQLTCKGLKHYHCEYNLLFSIFFNLIHNAIVFSDKSKPDSRVTCFVDVTEDGIRLMVDDNGIGIPENIQDKIFGMFYRGNRLSRGAGLGLYIAKSILDRFNGKIRIESRENIGTIALVVIPFLSSNKTNNLLYN